MCLFLYVSTLTEKMKRSVVYKLHGEVKGSMKVHFKRILTGCLKYRLFFSSLHGINITSCYDYTTYF